MFSTLEPRTNSYVASVNTKNWYREGTDLWVEFGKEAPFGRKFSSKDSVKILRSAVRHHSVEGLFVLKKEAFGNT
jgi:hypothetical protein